MNILNCCLFLVIYKYILNVYNNIKFYFYTSGIHGLAQVFRCKSWYGALFWLVISIGGAVSFTYLLRSSIEIFDNQPVLRHIDTTAYPISLVPFPAVTICSFNFVYKPKSDKIKAILIRNGVKEELANEFLGNMALLKIPASVNSSHYSKLYQILTANGYNDNEKLMEDIAHPCDKILEFCSWAGEQVDCLSLFSQSKAEMGLCCSFNSHLYPIKKNSLRQYYRANAGPRFGLYVVLNMSTEYYVSSVFNANSVIVYVHNMAAYAEDSAFFAIIGPGREISMKISAEIFKADPELKQINIKARKCLQHGEGSRVLNQHYSLANCMHLCKRNAIGKICGCVPHFYPDLGTWDSCTLMDLPCLKYYMENFTALHTSSDVHDRNRMAEISCDCLPSCSGINYGGSLETLFYQNTSEESMQKYKKGAVRVYFKNNWSKKYTIIRATTVDTFIALVGGLFALCLGGSLLSFVELFYFALKSLLTKYKGKTHFEDEGFKPDLYWAELEVYSIRKSVSKTTRPVQYNIRIDNFVN